MHEWVVIAGVPTCAAAPVAYDEERRAPSRPSQRFQAVWTTGVASIEPMVTAFYHTIGQPVPVFVPNLTAMQRANMAMHKELSARLRAIR